MIYIPPSSYNFDLSITTLDLLCLLLICKTNVSVLSASNYTAGHIYNDHKEGNSLIFLENGKF